MTDFTEPQNMFCLTMNSPPSAKLDGSCGCGPDKEELKALWHIAVDEDRGHVFIEGIDKTKKSWWRKSLLERS